MPQRQYVVAIPCRLTWCWLVLLWMGMAAVSPAQGQEEPAPELVKFLPYAVSFSTSQHMLVPHRDEGEVWNSRRGTLKFNVEPQGDILLLACEAPKLNQVTTDTGEVLQNVGMSSFDYSHFWLRPTISPVPPVFGKAEDRSARVHTHVWASFVLPSDPAARAVNLSGVTKITYATGLPQRLTLTPMKEFWGKRVVVPGVDGLFIKVEEVKRSSPARPIIHISVPNKMQHRFWSMKMLDHHGRLMEYRVRDFHWLVRASRDVQTWCVEVTGSTLHTIELEVFPQVQTQVVDFQATNVPLFPKPTSEPAERKPSPPAPPELTEPVVKTLQSQPLRQLVQ